MTVLAATGHRPDKLGGYGQRQHNKLFEMAVDWLYFLNPDEVISGMALGWDQQIAMAAYVLGIPFTAAIPFEGQERQWPVESQKRYRDLLKQAATVHVVSFGPHGGAFQQRNAWMVDRADEMLALWDGSTGGTFNCIEYARKRKVPVRNLWDAWSGNDLRDLLS